MQTVLYLCYGCGPQVDETIYSLISAIDRAPPRADFQYVVYADHPELFAELPVILRELSASEVDDWTGVSGYVHRRKTMTIIDALERYPGAVAFVDCDTYYLRSPERLFDRIAPGRSCLHLREARLLESGTKVDRAISELVESGIFLDLYNKPYSISQDAVMWNSGVVGIHSDDKELMLQSLHLIDQMWETLKWLKIEAKYGYPVHHIEQFATGVVFNANLIRETGDIVFHYWPENLRIPFRQILPELLVTFGVDDPNRASKLYARRPQADFLRKFKQQTRAIIRSTGMRVSGMRASA